MMLVLLLLAFSAAATNFYELLDVPKNADSAQIKKAFRKKSLEYHPDKNPGKQCPLLMTSPGDEAAAEKFKWINRAQEVLLDETKRQIYDTQGEEEVERYEQ